MDGHMTIEACRASGGTGHAVTDELIWETQLRLSREEGIFCEPAGAAALAGAIQAHRQQLVDPAATIVCCVTGSGFKDPSSVERMLAGRACPLVSPAEFSRLK
jgi:threonine synthase